MKWIAFISLLSTSLFSHAQAYIPFISTVDSSDQWMDYKSCSYMGGNNCLEHHLTAFSINGDTTINSEQYAKITAIEQHWFTAGVTGSGNCPSGTDYASFFAGGMREVSKQVFFYDPTSNSEYLMYDFNLVVGDTAPDPSGWSFSPQFRIISSIDSVLIGSSYRKLYNLQEINGWITQVIEGIGSSTGLLYHIAENISCFSEHLCYQENSVSLYPIGASCDMNLNLDEKELIFEISPNPAQDYLTIQSDLGTNLELINGFGQTVRAQTLNQSSNNINISDLSSGIYFVKLSVDGKVGVQKLVIE